MEHITRSAPSSGADKKPLKAREGDAVYIWRDLLDEVVARALCVVQDNADREPAVEETIMGPDGMEKIAQVVGYGAVKYADLCQNRLSDYVFSWDKMLTIDGNSATYMQYAYSRNRAIFREGHVDPRSLRQHPPPVILDHPMERALAAQLTRLEESLTASATGYHPHDICAYLWDLCKAYSGFYRDCQVLKAETPELRQSRLLLCDLTLKQAPSTFRA